LTRQYFVSGDWQWQASTEMSASDAATETAVSQIIRTWVVGQVSYAGSDSKDGDTAMVPLHIALADRDDGKAFIFNLRLRLAGDHWRIVGLSLPGE